MMREMSLKELSPVLGGVLGGSSHGDARFEQVDTDSRAVHSKSVFVALIGKRFDGNDYVAEAASRGAKVAIVSRSPDVDIHHLHVEDTTETLGRMGAFNRQLFKGPVIAVSGSSGKTTCKDMIATILGSCYPVYATAQNQNNEIGVPLNLLALSAGHRAAVIELAARAGGQIDRLANWVRPNVALLTNAQSAHIQGFGSVRGVMRGKGELLGHISQQGYSGATTQEGVAVLPHGRLEYEYWRSLCAPTTRVISFGLSREADVFVDTSTNRLMLGAGEHQVPLELGALGTANKLNAAAAAAVAIALDIELKTIADALRGFEPAPGRLKLLCRNPAIIDDTYNANPDSTRAAIDALAEYRGRRLLMLGDMADLGESSERYHRDMGRYARQKGIEYFWCCGRWMRYSARAFGSGTRHYESRDDMLDDIEEIPEADAILVKGSRVSQMEIVAQAVLDTIKTR
jgi:UDP-N-acetylmuramoyl-tripeptide--D-alanyl-D-alanine ligase